MKKTLVWDLPTRLFHWLLVISIIGQYATAEWLDNAVQWHFYLGYFTLFLIVFRLMWGIFGTKYAQFNSFVKGPSAVFEYLTSLFKRNTPPAAGHNALGGWFVLIMLILVGAQAVSGLFLTDDIFLDGPFRAMANEDTLAIMNTIHHWAFEILLYVIAMHILAMVFYTGYKKQKLVPAMLHGKKEGLSNEGIASSLLLRALIIAIVAAGIVYVAIEIVPPSPDIGEVYY